MTKVLQDSIESHKNSNLKQLKESNDVILKAIDIYGNKEIDTRRDVLLFQGENASAGEDFRWED